MSVVNRSRRLTARHNPLGAEHEDHEDHVDDGPGTDRRYRRRAVWRGGILELARRGNSATKRAAIVRRSDDPDGPSGSAAINEANLSVAVSLGNCASLAASCQGSTSSRANAERTLSSISFLSSPIGANRKSLNSDPRKEAEAECVISATEFRRLNRTPRARRVRGFLSCCSREAFGALERKTAARSPTLRPYRSEEGGR